MLFYVGNKDNPARHINLRAIDPERYTIVNEAAGGEVLEEIEESKAFFEVYDGAVYLYQVRSRFVSSHSSSLSGSVAGKNAEDTQSVCCGAKQVAGQAPAASGLECLSCSAARGEATNHAHQLSGFLRIHGPSFTAQGRTYLCKKLDLSSKVAVVRPADLKYYTKTRDFCDVHVIGGRTAYAKHTVRLPPALCIAQFWLGCLIS